MEMLWERLRTKIKEILGAYWSRNAAAFGRAYVTMRNLWLILAGCTRCKNTVRLIAASGSIRTKSPSCRIEVYRTGPWVSFEFHALDSYGCLKMENARATLFENKSENCKRKEKKGKEKRKKKIKNIELIYFWLLKLVFLIYFRIDFNTSTASVTHDQCLILSMRATWVTGDRF